MQPQRATVGRQLFDIEDDEAGRLEDTPRRQQREVREVLMIDSAELVFGKQALEMGEFEGCAPPRHKKDPHASHKIVQFRHLREDVVRYKEIVSSRLRDQLLR